MSQLAVEKSNGIVVGTAGHIDHGKTSLVHALTGIDTDRLAEEKRRGISIDLGFAHLALSGGQTVSFIDVPGHERFVKNMLAGASGIEAVLLVVAADESVKPQTREHFEICRLLGIQRGLIALTKADLAAPEQISKTRHDVQTLCAGSFLENAPVLLVSSVTGAGLPELKEHLAQIARFASVRDHTGLTRLPLDRSFALKGFGTVVTGTLWSGFLRSGDIVRIEPRGIHARIRGLQVHGRSVDVAVAGQRTAVNLSGVEAAEIERGFVLTHGDGLETTKALDVCVEWLSDAETPSARQEFLFHIGTSEVKATLKLHKEQSGRSTLARLMLAEPLLVSPGDRFVLRKPSPTLTVAGGTVLDAFPPLRLNRTKALLRARKLQTAELAERIRLLAEEQPAGQTFADLVRMTGRPPSELKASIRGDSALLFIEAVQRVVTTIWREERRKKLVTWLAAFHAKNRSLAGAPISQARLGLESSLAAVVFDHFPMIRIQGDTVSLARHQAQFTGHETTVLQNIERAFRSAGYQPAAVAEVLKAAGADSQSGRGLLESLIKSQKLVRVSDDLVFHADVISHIRKSLSVHKGRRFSVPEFKEWTQISRKYAIPLLEFLDHQHVTRREGDARIVL